MTGPSLNDHPKNRLLAWAKNLIEQLESPQTPFHYVLFTFFSIITLRNLLETFLNKTISSTDLFATDLPHYYLSYACLAMALIILFHFAAKMPVAKIARVVLPSFLVLTLPPLTWVLVPAWKKFSICYMYPHTHPDLALRFLTFFGSMTRLGITHGMRIEIALTVVASLLYFLVKGQSFLRSLWFSFLTYTLIFTYCALPFPYMALTHALGFGDEIAMIPALTNFLLVLILLLGLWQFYLYNKTYFKEIFKDIRPLRLLHFELMFFLGVALSAITHPRLLPLTPLTLSHGIFLLAAVAFAWAFAVTTNNIVDCDIDMVTSPGRPTVTGAIPTGHYRYFPWIFGGLAIIYSGAVNLISLFLVLVFMGNYFLYSMPPLRLKRVTFFSKLMISLNSLILVLLGHLFHSGDFEIPINVILFFLVCVTAALNFIDIKDYEGDKKAGIKTLPVVLGLDRSKKAIGLFFVVSYVTAGVIFSKSPLLATIATGLGLAQFFFINRKFYQEGHVMGIYLLSVAVFIFFLRS